jgi:glycosyltransferase involved in cell wall biosynthesis
MDLSIIICSYNRYKLARESAAAVATSSSFDRSKMELIVVENTPLQQRKAFELHSDARMVVCDEPGLSHARNAGIAASSGKIVAFVDDDAVVSDQWCTAVLTAFALAPKAAIGGGRTVPRFTSETRPPWYYDALAHYLSCIDWGPHIHPIEPGQWIVGANMAFRREVFEQAGYFDPALGRKGEASLLSNEEIAMFKRVGRENVYYFPDMLAEHIIPDDRITLPWFRKRVFWQAVSDALAGEVYRSPEQAANDLYEIVARAPADIRGHRLLSYAPDTPDAMKDQLSAIYAQGLLMAWGFPPDAMKA